ncbi:MAG: VanZ family protein, partial [Paraclostridium sp.]
FKIVLFKYKPLADVFTGYIGMGFRSANLIPFKTIVDFIKIGMTESSLLWAFSNIFGNICIFMPLGYLLPMFFEKFRSLKNTAIVAITLSIFFEITQYVLAIGSLDIDDLILNTIGGISGYLVYVGIKKLINDEKKLYKVTLALSIIACVIAFTIAREQFGNLLGLTTHEVTTIGEENIPKREPDIMGTYLGSEGNKLNMYKGIVAENSSDIDFLENSNIEISDETKFYSTEIEGEEEKSTITYKELSKGDFLKQEAYSILKIWYDEDNKSVVDTIEVSKKLDTSGQTVMVENNDKREVNGVVEEINNEGIVINLVTVQKFEDGSSTSISGKGEQATLVNVEFSEDARLILNLGKPNGDLIERKECKKEDIEVEDSVVLKGMKKGDTFITDDVEIYRMVE